MVSVKEWLLQTAVKFLLRAVRKEEKNFLFPTRQDTDRNIHLYVISGVLRSGVPFVLLK